MTVHVDPGITPTTITTGLGALGTGGLIALFLRLVGPWRKQTSDAETKLREEQAATITRLDEKVTKLEAKLERTERRHDAHIGILSQLHAAEMAVMRHRLGNEETVNGKLLATVRAGSPDKIAALIDVIEGDHARRQEALALEQTELLKLRASALESLQKLRDEA